MNDIAMKMASRLILFFITLVVGVVIHTQRAPAAIMTKWLKILVAVIKQGLGATRSTRLQPNAIVDAN